MKKKDAAAGARPAEDFDRRHAARNLRPRSEGEDVWGRGIPCKAKVLSAAGRQRSYVVETPTGVIQRNRRHLVPFRSPQDESSGHGEGDAISDDRTDVA